jgi:hypothetical protein
VLVEVVCVVVREQDYVDVRQVMQIHGWVCLALAPDAGAEMDVVASVEEVWLGC